MSKAAGLASPSQELMKLGGDGKPPHEAPDTGEFPPLWKDLCGPQLREQLRERETTCYRFPEDLNRIVSDAKSHGYDLTGIRWILHGESGEIGLYLRRSHDRMEIYVTLISDKSGSLDPMAVWRLIDAQYTEHSRLAAQYLAASQYGWPLEEAPYEYTVSTVNPYTGERSDFVVRGQVLHDRWVP